LNPAALLISSKINASRRGKKDKHTNFGVLAVIVGANQWISNSFLDGMDSLNAVFGG
jgi:hypothetical protein